MSEEILNGEGSTPNQEPTIDTPAGNDEPTETPEIDPVDQPEGGEGDDSDVVTLTKDEYEAMRKKGELADNYKIRAEKAERGNKQTASKGSDDGFTPEQGKLYSRIYSSDLPDELADGAVERVQKIAKLDGITLDEAYKSEDFKVWKNARVKELQARKAELPPSRGGQPKPKKTIDTPGLTEEEHKAFWKEGQ